VVRTEVLKYEDVCPGDASANNNLAWNVI
jgi:hypothetical protein